MGKDEMFVAFSASRIGYADVATTYAYDALPSWNAHCKQRIRSSPRYSIKEGELLPSDSSLGSVRC
jgi:hypothetical protein